MAGKKDVPRSVAFSRELWEEVRASAAKNGRKLADQVRYLIEQGLKSEEGADVSARLRKMEQQLEHLMVAEGRPPYHPGRGSPQKAKGTASNG